jgi:hypothetical protein
MSLIRKNFFFKILNYFYLEYAFEFLLLEETKCEDGI